MAHDILSWRDEELIVADVDVDERCRMILRSGSGVTTAPGREGLSTFRIKGELIGVLFYGEAEDGYGVLRVVVGDVEATSETGRPPLGDGTR